MRFARAIANNDVAFLSWRYDDKIPNCLGFAVYRVHPESGAKEALPTFMGFKESENKDWISQSSYIWPVQQFYWRDLMGIRGNKYRYEVVPMINSNEGLQPRDDLAVTTNDVFLSHHYDNISAYFNRGILSTQFLAHLIQRDKKGKPCFSNLIESLKTQGNYIRESLAGQLREGIMSLLLRAKMESGSCYCALYELTDPELIGLLKNTPSVHLILSNAGDKDDIDKENRPAREELKSNAEVFDRMFTNSHIGHNKFCVYVDKNYIPKAVLSGSTNWTYQGLCGQSNNTIIIESVDIAKHYLAYWNRLRDDTQNSNSVDGLQGPKFREDNNKIFEDSSKQGQTRVSVWFSPNTIKPNKPNYAKQNEGKNPQETFKILENDKNAPKDMCDVFKIIESAKECILFLLFQPGFPSILEKIQQVKQNNDGLYILGAKTDIPEKGTGYSTEIYNKSLEKADMMIESEAEKKSDNTVILTRAINDSFANYYKELLVLPGGHAIIHDKIVVIDPLSSTNCAVITGSHNLGYKASFSNDENLLIIKGNLPLTKAYATHVMDISEHYRWRYFIHKYGLQNRHQLSGNDDWQDEYFVPDNSKLKEIKYWTSCENNP